MTSKDIEKLYVWLHGYAPSCAIGNSCKFSSYLVGHRRCGPASTCICTKYAVANQISKTASQQSQIIKDSIKHKRQVTTLSRYVVDNIFKDVDKIKCAVISKYGVSNVNKLSAVRQKIANTNHIRYGGNSPATSQVVKDKAIATSNDRYGVDYASQSLEVQQKIKSTLLANYQVASPIHHAGIRSY